MSADAWGALRAYAERGWAKHAGDESDMSRLVEELPDGSLPTAFEAIARAHPDRPAVEIDGDAATHGELDDRSARFAGWLRAMGIEAGDPVLIGSAGSLTMVVAYLGALRAGAVVVLANPTLTVPELRHLLDDSGAVVALASAPVAARLAEAAGGEPLRQIVDLDQIAADPDASGPAAAAPLPPSPPDPDRPALLAYTSGTTGKPKAAVLTHGNLLSSIRAAMLAWRWTHDDVCVHALPLYHQHGLGAIHAALLSGSRAVIRSRFDPSDICDRIRAESATVLFAVPAMYERLMAWEGVEDAGLDQLRLLVSGSSALAPGLAERVAAIAGQVPLERYGTTESGLDVSNPYDGPRRPGTVGLPLPGVELAIVDDHGLPLSAGEAGEILLRGPQVFPGYRGATEAATDAFSPGAWFRTGDIGRLDPHDGYLAITGRAKELIVTGGMNVYPREVEFALLAAPAVRRVAVVGMPSVKWGEEVVAVVVPDSPSEPDATKILEFARSRLAPYKCPKRVVFADEIPVNAMGKVVAARVVDLVNQIGEG